MFAVFKRQAHLPAAVLSLAQPRQQVAQAQDGIAHEVQQGPQAVDQLGTAVLGVGAEVERTVQALREVSLAAQQSTRIALRTRRVAFNASVEVKRAGEIGRGARTKSKAACTVPCR
jgi:methyl-accepting chemotaxis protein